MAASIRTARPNFHHITGTQPVGQTQIATSGDYAGTVTLVKRVSAEYWQVIVRPVRDAFRGAGQRAAGCTVLVWADPEHGGYVADYWDTARSTETIEAGRARSLRAALGIAITTAGQRGNQLGYW